MDKNIKGKLKMDIDLEVELIIIMIFQSMLENFCIILEMVMASSITIIKRNMKDNGKKIIKMVKENTLILMVVITRETLPMVIETEKVFSTLMKTNK
jgi:hypothetical protein